MSYTNVSNKESTVKKQFSAMESDNWSLRRTEIFIRYQTNTVIPYESILDNYRDYLDKYLVTVTLERKYWLQPAAFADHYYGDPGLDWMVLYFAKIPTLFEFNKKTIKVLPLTKMAEVNQILVKKRDDVNKSNSDPKTYT